MSQISPSHSFAQEEVESLTKRIQFGGDEVVKAKDGAGSATLSMAQAGARFASSILNATVGGESGIIEPSYVCLDADGIGGKQVKDIVSGLDYFSSNIELGKNGVEKIHPLGDLNEYEKKLLEAAIPELKTNISKGVSFVADGSKF